MRMFHTPTPPTEGYACYLATLSLANAHETAEPTQPAIAPWGVPSREDSSSSLSNLRLRKSLDDLDEETDDEDEEDDLESDDEEDEDEDEDDDLDDDYDEDEDEDDEDEEDDDDDEDEEDDEDEDDEDDVKPLKMASLSAR